MKWNTIDSVPRNGKTVLLWSKKHGFFAGNCPDYCMPGVWHKINGSWYGEGFRAAEEATHWAELEEP